ncbi:hypothetical protein BTW15_01305 [Pseudomonas syringae pv. tomato]|uniref:Uncharacterized protein n=2 Tax=root TaxID=1 RepID=A0A8E7FPG9_9CAUD|nr:MULTISPECIES: hypothetical protein [Pseudomonas syringae group]YP_010772967.1 hypothetical protein QIT78_gp37 [Pseudomonas phage Medea1]MBI6849053.1 hypothetical protein [Pseudomonas syringae]MBX6510482.1 hypothetical protein [Pseudomonas syringae pv. tomato]OPE62014.1 hypothetical protein BTW15_01305 [Pseudomonas syringae pv. tomato]QVW29104.1 hypothetical protein Medea1_0037 [Pseudomonas phage Medea1]
MPHPTFHSAGDGRGHRRVFVNGNEIDDVLWCDTAVGIVVYARRPARAKRPAREEVYTRRLRGRVAVTLRDGE